jgi:excisionase family DNA binding protein
MDDNLLTLPEVRTRLKVSYHTLNRYINAGEIIIVRVSRTKRYVRQEDLDKFIREHTGVYKQ